MCPTSLVCSANIHDGEDIHVSVHSFLMKGPHDYVIEQSGHWPLMGTFTMELLDQINDNDHHSQKLRMY